MNTVFPNSLLRQYEEMVDRMPRFQVFNPRRYKQPRYGERRRAVCACGKRRMSRYNGPWYGWRCLRGDCIVF